MNNFYGKITFAVSQKIILTFAKSEKTGNAEKKGG